MPAVSMAIAGKMWDSCASSGAVWTRWSVQVIGPAGPPLVHGTVAHGSPSATQTACSVPPVASSGPGARNGMYSLWVTGLTTVVPKWLPPRPVAPGASVGLMAGVFWTYW